MEGKSLGSALLPRISNITEKLLYKSGAISLWSLVLKKKLNFFGPLPNTEDKSLENALLFLNGDIAEKVGC